MAASQLETLCPQVGPTPLWASHWQRQAPSPACRVLFISGPNGSHSSSGFDLDKCSSPPKERVQSWGGGCVRVCVCVCVCVCFKSVFTLLTAVALPACLPDAST